MHSEGLISLRKIRSGRFDFRSVGVRRGNGDELPAKGVLIQRVEVWTTVIAPAAVWCNACETSRARSRDYRARRLANSSRTAGTRSTGTSIVVCVVDS